MRPGQNKRMRGRPTNGRRGPNPLTRSYESNGPDVKIRGNAQHVAEKYLQLARDAHTGGDPVAAENYLQHAEHYFRLIAAAQAAQAMAQSGQARPPGEGDVDDLDDDDDYSALSDRFASPSERAAASFPQQQGAFPIQSGAPNAPQPYLERPAFDADRQGQNDRGGFQPRQDRQNNRFPDRGPRQDRPFGDRGDGYRDNRQNCDGRPRDFRPYRDAGPQPQPARENAPEAVGAAALPSFITGPTRTTAPEPDAPPPPIAEVQPAARGRGERDRSARLRRSPGGRGPVPATRPASPAAIPLWLQRRAIGSGPAERRAQSDERRLAGQRIGACDRSAEGRRWGKRFHEGARESAPRSRAQ